MKIKYLVTYLLKSIAPVILIGIPVVLIVFFWDKYKESKINECQKVTIAYPTKFSGRSDIYYKFTLNGKTFERGYTIPFPTMGKFERGRHLLKERFWIRVNCNDDYYNKIYWEAKVPDTLNYVPFGGWNKIPYGLDSLKE